MNRGLLWFVLFLIALGTVMGVGTWLLGPNTLAFLFHAERSTAPFVMVNLLAPIPRNGASDDDALAPADVERLLATATERLGGEALWVAAMERVVSGSLDDGWPLIVLVEHPSRAHFVDQLAVADLGNLTGLPAAQLSRSAVLAATHREPPVVAATTAYAVRLLASIDADGLTRYLERWLPEERRHLERFGGDVIWQASLNPLAAQRHDRFDHMLVFGFDDRRRRDLWLADSGRATTAALQARLFRRDIMLAVRPILPARVQEEAPSLPVGPERPLSPAQQQPHDAAGHDPVDGPPAPDAVPPTGDDAGSGAGASEP